MTRLQCLARYGNRALGITAAPGDVIEVDTEMAGWLQRDAPDCWTVEAAADPAPIKAAALDAPPADRMVSRHRGRPPVRK